MAIAGKKYFKKKPRRAARAGLEMGSGKKQTIVRGKETARLPLDYARAIALA